jgi:endo-1,4-beta-xylanase
MHSMKFILTTLLAIVLGYLPTGASAQTVNGNGTGTNNGFYYSLYSSGGSATMTLGSAGNYSINWSGVSDVVGGKGFNPGSAQAIGYNVASASGYNNISIYGWLTNPLVEYYITEFGNLYTADATEKGTVTSDGHTYTTYEHQQVNQPSIQGTTTFEQYLDQWGGAAMGQNGVVTTTNHFNHWSSLGMTVGSFNYQILGTEAYSGASGSVNATVCAGSCGGGGGGGTEGPYGGTPASIPGTVMAENYDTGGQGVGYNVTSTNGTDNAYRSDGVDLETATSPATGNDLGWTASGQWFKYTVNVATAGTYSVTFLVAGNPGASDAFHLSNSSGTNLTGSVAVPSTGGWQTWTTVTASVTLPAGKQTLTLNEDAGGWNIDSMAFSSGSVSCTTDPSAPTGLTATSESSSAINLGWGAVTAPSNCTISAYHIFRSTTSGFTPSSSNQIASVSSGTAYSDSGLSASTTYYYAVEAVDAAGSSSASSQASAETGSTTGGGSFTLSASANSVPVTQGASATDTVSVNDVNGFSGSVSLSASGLPSGVTATFGTNPTTGSSVVTFSASSSAAAGTSIVTIMGTSGSLTSGASVTLTVNPSTGGSYCQVVYTISSQWQSGFGAAITIENTGTTNWNNWTLTWTFANGQTISSLWNGSETQSGANVTVSNLSYNGSIPAGTSYTGMGFNGTWNNSTNAVPTNFAVNGTTCH